jgi:hypothetical protein
MKNDLRYLGRVTAQGDIRLPKHVGDEVRGAFAGKDIEVIFRRPRKQRSNEQNRYYWGAVIPAILQGFRDLGNDVQPGNPEDAEVIHQYLKARFLPPREVADAAGEAHRLPGSTAGLSTAQFMDYIAAVQQFAAEYLNVNIPDPGEQIMLL